MKALFCHDHFYYRLGDSVFSHGQYHHSVWERYLKHFDHLTVIGRDGGSISDKDKNINPSHRDHVSFTLFPNMNSLSGLLKKRKDIKHKIKELVQSHDVIILRGISEIGTLAFFEAKKQNKIIAIEAVADPWDELWNHGSWKAKAYAPYRYMMARYQIAQADAVIYVSQHYLQEHYPSKAKLQAAASNVQIEKSAFSKKSSPPQSPFKIGMIGTLKNKLKGVHIAIEACQILKKENIDFTFHVLGPGDPKPYQNMVNNMSLHNCVFFDGIRESGEPVYQWLCDLDLYIQPSFQEGVPRAMIEAMAQSLPCIGSRVGGVPELLDEGWIIPKGNAENLADKIIQMMNNPDQMKAEGSKNYDRAMDYDHEKLSAIRNDFWGQVAAMASHSRPE